VSETHKVVANVAMGYGESSTNWETHSSMARRARENLLGNQGVFGEGILSAGGSSFWLGKLCRVYLTSTIWNLGNARWSTAVSRLALVVAAFASTNVRMLQPDFWLALARPYRSRSFGWNAETHDSAPTGIG
jgi:hypothetical protein